MLVTQDLFGSSHHPGAGPGQRFWSDNGSEFISEVQKALLALNEGSMHGWSTTGAGSPWSNGGSEDDNKGVKARCQGQQRFFKEAIAQRNRSRVEKKGGLTRDMLWRILQPLHSDTEHLVAQKALGLHQQVMTPAEYFAAHKDWERRIGYHKALQAWMAMRGEAKLMIENRLAGAAVAAQAKKTGVKPKKGWPMREGSIVLWQHTQVHAGQAMRPGLYKVEKVMGHNAMISSWGVSCAAPGAGGDEKTKKKTTDESAKRTTMVPASSLKLAPLAGPLPVADDASAKSKAGAGSAQQKDKKEQKEKEKELKSATQRFAGLLQDEVENGGRGNCLFEAFSHANCAPYTRMPNPAVLKQRGLALRKTAAQQLALLYERSPRGGVRPDPNKYNQDDASWTKQGLILGAQADLNEEPQAVREKFGILDLKFKRKQFGDTNLPELTSTVKEENAFWKGFCAYLSTEGMWAGELALQALERHFKCLVQIWSTDNPRVIRRPPGGWHNGRAAVGGGGSLSGVDGGAGKEKKKADAAGGKKTEKTKPAKTKKQRDEDQWQLLLSGATISGDGTINAAKATTKTAIVAKEEHGGGGAPVGPAAGSSAAPAERVLHLVHTGCHYRWLRFPPAIAGSAPLPGAASASAKNAAGAAPKTKTKQNTTKRVRSPTPERCPLRGLTAVVAPEHLRFVRKAAEQPPQKKQKTTKTSDRKKDAQPSAASMLNVTSDPVPSEKVDYVRLRITEVHQKTVTGRRSGWGREFSDPYFDCFCQDRFDEDPEHPSPD